MVWDSLYVCLSAPHRAEFWEWVSSPWGVPCGWMRATTHPSHSSCMLSEAYSGKHMLWPFSQYLHISCRCVRYNFINLVGYIVGCSRDDLVLHSVERIWIRTPEILILVYSFCLHIILFWHCCYKVYKCKNESTVLGRELGSFILVCLAFMYRRMLFNHTLTLSCYWLTAFTAHQPNTPLVYASQTLCFY